MAKNVIKEAEGTIKRAKIVGIITAILMIILGLITFIAPIEGETIFIWMMIIGLLIFGVQEIIVFFRSPKGNRSGLALVCGILFVILAVMTIIRAVNATAIEAIIALGTFNYVLAVVVGVSLIFDGVNAFILSGRAEELGHSKGGMIVVGILDIICALIIMSFPIGSIITLHIFFGIFLFVGGISLLVKCFSMHTK